MWGKIAFSQWGCGCLTQLCAPVALNVDAAHAVGATVVPGEVALQSRLFRVHTHNNLLKNDRRFRTARAQRVQTVILGQKWVEPSRCTLLTTKISEKIGFADYHPDRRRVGTDVGARTH